MYAAGLRAGTMRFVSVSEYNEDGAGLILRRSRSMGRVGGQAVGGRLPLGIVASLNFDFALAFGRTSRLAGSRFDRLQSRRYAS